MIAVVMSPSIISIHFNHQYPLIAIYYAYCRGLIASARQFIDRQAIYCPSVGTRFYRVRGGGVGLRVREG